MMCLVLLGGVWEHIVKWRTHMFTVFFAHQRQLFHHVFHARVVRVGA